MSEEPENATVAPSEAKSANPDGSAAGSEEAGDAARKPGRRRRRKRGRGRSGARAEGAAPPASGGGDSPSAESAPVSGSDPTAAAAASPTGEGESEGGGAAAPSAEPPAGPDLSALSAGLFSHIDDREVPCKVEGCDNMWVWAAAEQIKAFGQPPPKRMCPEHYAQFHTLADREVPCASPGCEHTWTWAKNAQMSHLQKAGSDEPPQRTCDSCRRAERELADVQIQCRVDPCKRTWTWTRDAQLRHRSWLRRQSGETGEAREPEGGGRRKRSRKRRPSVDSRPRRMCDLCKDKLEKLVEREVTCKVHGCTRNAPVDKESQLRGWAALGTDDLDKEAPLPKRMCDVCREFCRLHPDREVACGRPGCERSWTYKTGAQLQAFLAGRLEDPIRLCDECTTGAFTRQEEDQNLPPGVEIMPCVVPGCDGTWRYESGMSIAPAEDGDRPADRMCEKHRAEDAPASEPIEVDPARSEVATDPAAPVPS